MRLIVANWKMNPISSKRALEIFNQFLRGITISHTEVIICPPFLYLPFLSTKLKKLKEKKIKLGAQDCAFAEKGAFTGEISPLMLKDLGVKFVILGHSERRMILKETDEIINKKLKEALKTGLQPILCIGETIAEREKGKTFLVLENEIKKGLKGISRRDAAKILFAYEPIWAIGKRDSCPVHEVMIEALSIRKILTGLYNKKIAKSAKILYGGSIDSTNVNDYLHNFALQGFLVGGSSIEPKDFVKIVKIAGK